MDAEELIQLIAPNPDDPRIQAAIAELRDRIAVRYPEAAFSVYCGEDPDGIYLKAVVDVADLDEVADVVMERLVDFQTAGLPVYLALDWPLERIRAYLRDHKSAPIEERLPAILP